MKESAPPTFLKWGTFLAQYSDTHKPSVLDTLPNARRHDSRIRILPRPIKII